MRILKLIRVARTDGELLTDSDDYTTKRIGSIYAVVGDHPGRIHYITDAQGQHKSGYIDLKSLDFDRSVGESTEHIYFFKTVYKE